MFDVGQNELLMLLLVVHAELDQSAGLRSRFLTGKECKHGLIYVLPVRQHLGKCWTRKHSPFRPWMFLPDRVVVRIEKNPIV